MGDELGQMIQVEMKVIDLFLKLGLPLLSKGVKSIASAITKAFRHGAMKQSDFFKLCEGQYYIVQVPDGTLKKDGKLDPNQPPSSVDVTRQYLRQNGVSFTHLADLNPDNGVTELAIPVQDVGILGKLLKEHGATMCERDGRPLDNWGLRALSIKDYLSTDKTYAEYQEKEQEMAQEKGEDAETVSSERMPEGMPVPAGTNGKSSEELENEILNSSGPTVDPVTTAAPAPNPVPKPPAAKGFDEIFAANARAAAAASAVPPLMEKGAKPEPVKAQAGADKPADVVKKEGATQTAVPVPAKEQSVDLSIKPLSKMRDELGENFVIDSVSVDEAKWVKGDGGKPCCEVTIPGKFINPHDHTDVGQVVLRLQPEQVMQATVDGQERFVFGFDKEQPAVAVCRYEKSGEDIVAPDILPYLHLPKQEIPEEVLGMTRELDTLQAVPEDIAKEIAPPKAKVVPSLDEERREFEQLAAKLGIDTSKLNFATDAEGKTLGNGKVAATRENIIENLADRDDLPNFAMPDIPDFGAR